MTLLDGFGLSPTVFEIPECDIVSETHISPKWYVRTSFMHVRGSGPVQTTSQP
jgi:hypothetical protein